MNWAASMQLHVWLGAAHDETRQGVERHLGKTMQRQFVHLVEREVHHSREPAFDHQAAAGEPAHHVADGAELTQRDERTEVAVAVVPQRPLACARGGTKPPWPSLAS